MLTTTLREFSVNMVGKIIDFTGQTGMNEVWTCSFTPVARYVFTSTRKLKTGTFVEKWLRWNSFGPHLIGDDIGLASSTQLTWQSYSAWIAPNPPMQVFFGNLVDDVIQWNDGHWTLVIQHADAGGDPRA